MRVCVCSVASYQLHSRHSDGNEREIIVVTLLEHSSVGVPRLQKQYWILVYGWSKDVGNTKKHYLTLPYSCAPAVSVRETTPPRAHKRLATSRDALAAP